MFKNRSSFLFQKHKKRKNSSTRQTTPYQHFHTVSYIQLPLLFYHSVTKTSSVPSLQILDPSVAPSHHNILDTQRNISSTHLVDKGLFVFLPVSNLIFLLVLWITTSFMQFLHNIFHLNPEYHTVKLFMHQSRLLHNYIQTWVFLVIFSICVTTNTPIFLCTKAMPIHYVHSKNRNGPNDLDRLCASKNDVDYGQS